MNVLLSALVLLLLGLFFCVVDCLYKKKYKPFFDEQTDSFFLKYIRFGSRFYERKYGIYRKAPGVIWKKFCSWLRRF